MRASLDAGALAAYRRDGFFFPVTVMAADEAATYRAAFEIFDRSAKRREHADPLRELYLFKPHLLFTWADALVHHPGVLDAAEDVIGPDILCWSAGVFTKPPQSASFVSWHQDATRYGLDDWDGVVRVWLALTPTSRANGTMQFAPGSHRLGQVRHIDRPRPGEMLYEGETIDVDLDEAAAVDVVLAPGQASLHGLGTAHRSGPNTTAAPRINFVMTFVAPHVGQVPEPDSAILVRGRDTHHHFAPEPRPAADFAPQAVAAHRQAMALRRRTFRVLGEMQRRPDHNSEKRRGAA